MEGALQADLVGFVVPTWLSDPLDDKHAQYTELVPLAPAISAAPYVALPSKNAATSAVIVNTLLLAFERTKRIISTSPILEPVICLITPATSLVG